MQLPRLDEPYKFAPIYKSLFWCKSCQWILRPMLRKQYSVTRFVFRGFEHVVESQNDGKGIILAANHINYADPMVLGMMGLRHKRFFYYAASWHLFQTNRFDHWRLRRFGAFSVFREGADRESIRQGVEILSEADRPLVIFPEGTFYRQNDRVGPLLDGVAFIARQAAKKSERTIAVHPVMIKYYFVKDARAALDRRLRRLESAFEWDSIKRWNFKERIRRLTNAFVAIKEIDKLGEVGSGTLEERMEFLADFLVSRLEDEYFDGKRSGPIMDRIRGIRPLAVRKLRDSVDDETVRAKHWHEVYDLALAQQLFAHSLDYLDEWPTPERVGEAIQRLEEDVFNSEKPIANLGAVVEVGAPINPVDVPMGRRAQDGDPLSLILRERIQEMIDQQNEQGPPADWSWHPPEFARRPRGMSSL